ncbi:SRPBCC family protein [Rubripirellula sp.]|nr:SRPBCC family protein [Planctomycetaceae bacterium]MDA9859028.1 SRPBCC family protein [Rubripirellula sp.]MDF1840047.1 SRPBCC family protein [Rubripirellula sp.]
MTTIIDAPAEIVFLYLEDSDRLKRWIPNLVEDESIVETRQKIGSKFRQVFVEKSRTIEMTGEITEYVENEFIRVNMTGDMFGLDVGYRLTFLSDAQTEVTQDTQIKFKGFMKFVAPIFMLFSKLSSNNPQAEAHVQLKEMAEQEYQSQLS